jgi:transposase
LKDRESIILVRVKHSEFTSLYKLARNSGMTLSAWMRMLALAAAQAAADERERLAPLDRIHDRLP